MSKSLTNNGPQRKLLGIRKRCSNGHAQDEEIHQPTKYLKESDHSFRSSTNRSNISKPTNYTDDQGCGWFENSFCSTKKRTKRVEDHQGASLKDDNQKDSVSAVDVEVLQSCRTEPEDEDVISQKDIFEESFQDLDFLSHVESIESQNSVDFVDTVTDSPKENLRAQTSQATNNDLLPSNSIESDINKSSGLEKSFGEKKTCDEVESDKVALSKEINCDSECLKTKQCPSNIVCPEKNWVDSKISMVSETPSKSRSVRSFKDHLKSRLLQNKGMKSPVSPRQTIEEGQLIRLKEAEREAAILQDEGSADDIGPFYGLPSKVQQLLQKQRGVTSLYEWQDCCLRLPSLKKGGNLVYSLPTSGGKTLVAEMLILKELLCKKKNALMILPFVSIVQEKVRGMAQLAVELDFLVEEYAGSKGHFPPVKHRKRALYIATIEKAHSLVNSLLEQGRLGSLGLVVVDEKLTHFRFTLVVNVKQNLLEIVDLHDKYLELLKEQERVLLYLMEHSGLLSDDNRGLHMIGEGRSRGTCLEATLVKLIYSKAPTQVIGMSATLNNVSDLLAFLRADIFSSDFRPVKLSEYIKLQDNVFEVRGGHTLQESLLHERTVTFQYSPEMTRVDPDQLLGLVTEVIPDHSCLIFCSTKKNCENVALMLSKLMAKHRRELSQVRKQERKDLLKTLYKDGEQRVCPVLQHTIHFGIAYHHSGLTTDERHLLEEAYLEGVLCVLACTSTLAAGVNLPAKRVILRSPYIGNQFLNRSQYKQMIGRAGRAGKDTTGESILIVSPKDRCKVWEIISGPMENCFSSLPYDDGKGIRSLILSSIGLKIATITSEVFDLMSHTLLSIQASRLSCDIIAMTKDALQQLIDTGLVVQKRSLSQDEEGGTQSPSLEVTPLGRATFKGSIDLDFSSQLYKDLKRAEESLVLASHLHLLFLVTPYDLVKDVRPDWMIYFKQISLLTRVELKVAELIGVPEAYVAKKASGQHTRQLVDEFVTKRFYLTLMLYNLWKQKSVWEVAEKFELPRGFIQNLLSSSASFGACVHHFCQELEEFWAYQELLGTFVKQLAYCVSVELLPLMEISGVKLGRARQLFGAGIRSIAQLAATDPDNLVKSIKQISHKAARQIVASAKLLLNEKAEALLQEVENLVSVPVDLMTSQSSTVSLSQLNEMDLFSSAFSSQ